MYERICVQERVIYSYVPSMIMPYVILRGMLKLKLWSYSAYQIQNNTILVPYSLTLSSRSPL